MLLVGWQNFGLSLNNYFFGFRIWYRFSFLPWCLIACGPFFVLTLTRTFCFLVFTCLLRFNYKGLNGKRRLVFFGWRSFLQACVNLRWDCIVVSLAPWTNSLHSLIASWRPSGDRGRFCLNFALSLTQLLVFYNNSLFKLIIFLRELMNDYLKFIITLLADKRTFIWVQLFVLVSEQKFFCWQNLWDSIKITVAVQKIIVWKHIKRTIHRFLHLRCLFYS